jgi:hypothetical protein
VALLPLRIRTDAHRGARRSALPGSLSHVPDDDWPDRSALAASGEVLDATDCEQRGGGSAKNIAEAA